MSYWVLIYASDFCDHARFGFGWLLDDGWLGLNAHLRHRAARACNIFFWLMNRGRILTIFQ